MSKEISPLPWKINVSGYVTDLQSHNVVVSGFTYTVPGGSYITARVNAAYIVKAVNSHEALVGAIKYLLGCSVPMTGQQEECWKSLRAALAAAGTE